MDIGISTKSTEKYQTSAKVCNEEFKKNMIDHKVSTENTENYLREFEFFTEETEVTLK